MKKHYLFLFLAMSISLACAMDSDDEEDEGHGKPPLPSAPPPAYYPPPAMVPGSAVAFAPAPEQPRPAPRRSRGDSYSPHSSQKVTVVVAPAQAADTSRRRSSCSTVLERAGAWGRGEFPGAHAPLEEFDEERAQRHDDDMALRYRTAGSLPTGTPAQAREKRQLPHRPPPPTRRPEVFSPPSDEDGDDGDEDVPEEFPDDMRLPGTSITFAGRTEELLAALRNLTNNLVHEAEALHQQAEHNSAASGAVVRAYSTHAYATRPTGVTRFLPGSTDRHAGNVAKLVGQVDELQDAAQRKQVQHFRAAMVAIFGRLAKAQESIAGRSARMDREAAVSLAKIQSACGVIPPTFTFGSDTAGSPATPRRRTLSGGARETASPVSAAADSPSQRRRAASGGASGGRGNAVHPTPPGTPTPARRRALSGEGAAKGKTGDSTTTRQRDAK